jgi:hypothetical protein
MVMDPIDGHWLVVGQVVNPLNAVSGIEIGRMHCPGPIIVKTGG